MSENAKEKIAIVLINEYKHLVDRIKARRMKSAAAQIQVIEVSLHGLTEDRPTARKFFERVLEYRRSGDDGTGAIEIPVIGDDSSGEKEAVPAKTDAKPEHRQTVVIAKDVEEKTETKPEESPFEF